ncbi:MAG TPA: isoprenylcysteine carboxylmethyltransferase family protein [Pyrinomonadaceae bacterium]|jgi:protein-S-isoprenylcysteine O-methyltransferase Ste14|nr:isoprenylcysteine carboxylmethyltransferase family protein [Pyrinomonadaceae bacterium]
MNLLKTLIFTVLIPGTVTILLPSLLLPPAPAPRPFTPLNYLGVLAVALGACVYFWCAWDFATAGRGTPLPLDPPKELVVRGLYRHVRNPMYSGVLSILFGESLLFGSRALAVYALGFLVAYTLIVLFYEEPVLRRKFGEPYERYCRAVPRWLPRLSAHGTGR